MGEIRQRFAEEPQQPKIDQAQREEEFKTRKVATLPEKKPAPLQISAAPKEGKHGFSGMVRKGSEMTGADKGARFEAVEGGTDITAEAREAAQATALSERGKATEQAAEAAAIAIRAKYEDAPLDQLRGYAEFLEGELDELMTASGEMAEEGQMEEAIKRSEDAEIKKAELETVNEMIGEKEIEEATADAKEAANG